MATSYFDSQLGFSRRSKFPKLGGKKTPEKKYTPNASGFYTAWRKGAT